MVQKKDIIKAAKEAGFEDVGFTTARPFEDHAKLLATMEDEYAWTNDVGLDLHNGVDPRTILPEAKTIIVLMETYFLKSYPKTMESHFGRCYLDDDRVTKDGLYLRIKKFRSFLRDNGIDSKVPFNLPHRVAAARAGMGGFGKNCLFYSNKVVRGGSWTLPIAVVIDKEFTPGTPTIGINCPDWCKNTCIAACPTRALKGNGRIDPRKCISYLTYFGEGITPKELREPMGLYIYGCDRCQNVCPRNQPWLAKELPINDKVVAKAKDFDLCLLLHMDKNYFNAKIWPHMFYMSDKNLWRWKMNVARVMGNSLDPFYLPDLVRAFNENSDERVKAMIAWAMGHIGGEYGLSALKKIKPGATGLVKEELEDAMKVCAGI
ncbi:MAG: epoxyqueuosine reductase [Deltaproteobacteria bacterium]|uniref:epoxyqueuosine reductase n=1 Tax=Desulfobacula sp. TaxID=2593537 RepID=UPI0019BB0605|nr:epoxyqueuosine reductase [Candidatus Desulfobacula maris]MBL6993416.1 epoxyqueuosine reductase [Desulfobacula sp.]